ncbi:hypothetical protein CEXT_638501 [Caerostris extrusa]|uniref:Transposase IS200-like domain-containing protein n=1 Tax=Caerostris extrusa TaxID=172846 RepID=A0AAV4SZR7_CAEEX|nr:hypothetical protein CEXT_638501 [Caerostris extrusa]
MDFSSIPGAVGPRHGGHFPLVDVVVDPDHIHLLVCRGWQPQLQETEARCRCWWRVKRSSLIAGISAFFGSVAILQLPVDENGAVNL